MTRKRIPYKKYPIEDTIEFCRNTPDWREYAREKHDKVFTDLVNGLSIKEVCEKYSIKKGNIYDHGTSFAIKDYNLKDLFIRLSAFSPYLHFTYQEAEAQRNEAI